MFSSKLVCLSVLVCLVKVDHVFGRAPASEYFQVCSRSSKEFESCILNSIMAAKPKLVKGIPDIGLPVLDPLEFEPLNFYENTRLFKLKALFSDMHFGGLSDMTVKKVKVSGDVDNGMTMNITVTGPLFRIWGKWAGGGRALQFNVKDGSGNIDCNLTQTDFKLKIKGKSTISPADGKKYFSVKEVDLEPIIRKARLDWQNLFPNDEKLSQNANKFFNDNILFIFKVLKQYPKKYIGGEFTKIINKIFDSWPVDELMAP